MSYTIRTEAGESFAVATDEGSLLRGALRAGIGFPHECSVGGCGACRFDLLDGEMETLWDDAPGLSSRDRKRGKRLACQSRPTSDCTIRVRSDATYRSPITAVQRPAVLQVRRMITHDMAELTFSTTGAADFLPGQYAVFALPGTPGLRAYSMSNLPNADGIWQFIVRRTPVGSGSSFLVDRLAVGESVAIDAPYGNAYFRAESDLPIVCVAGGSGLAPMLSVARAAAANETAQVDFYFGGRTADDLCAISFLKDLPGFGDRLRLYDVLSSAPDPSWEGARGFVHEEVERTLGREFQGREFYFAGPPPMIDAVQQLLMVKHRVPFSQIHYDRFV